MISLLVFLGALFGGMLIGLPIAYALILTSLALMVQLDFFDSQIIAQNLLNGANSFPLMAVPFFMLAGELMNAGGISRRIVDLALVSVGHIRGGLGYVAILAACILASLSGSAAADAAALAALLTPMMVRAGYSPGRSAGLIAAAGTTALIIPPSIGFILIGVVGNLSITRIFIAGIFPGIMIGLALALAWYIVTRGTEADGTERASMAEVLRKLRDSVWALLLPLIILVGLRFGVFTPTEAGVIAAVYALFVSLVVYRELKVTDLFEVCLNAGKTTAMVMFLVAAATASSWMVMLAGLPEQISAMVEPFAESPRLMMAVIVLLVLVVGCVMDMVPIILIFVPVMLPAVKEAAIDPVYFAVVFMIACAVGLLTPPIGSVLNVVAGVSRVSLMQIIRGIGPFLLAQIGVLILILCFPEIVTIPAKLLGG